MNQKQFIKLNQKQLVARKTRDIEFKKASGKLDKWVESIWENPCKAKLPKGISATWILTRELINKCNEKHIDAFIQYVCRLELIIALFVFRNAYIKFGAKFSRSKYWWDKKSNGWFLSHSHFFDIVEAMKNQ